MSIVLTADQGAETLTATARAAQPRMAEPDARVLWEASELIPPCLDALRATEERLDRLLDVPGRLVEPTHAHRHLNMNAIMERWIQTCR